MKITGSIEPVYNAGDYRPPSGCRVDLEVTPTPPASPVDELLDDVRVHARIDDPALRYSQIDEVVATIRAALTRGR